MDVKGESGQSIFEFLFAMPMLIGMVMILIRLNTAIQMSLVNQQYSRAQALFLAYNSPFYPELEKQENLVGKSTNQLMVGVSDNPATPNYFPKASVQLIGRNRKSAGSNAPQEEPPLRSLVRVRNSVTLCTRSYFLGSGQPILALAGTPIAPVGNVALTELNAKSQFTNICGSPIQYEQ